MSARPEAARDSAGAMRVAVVVPVPWVASNPSRFSIDPGLIVRGFRDLGHDAMLVCAEGSEYRQDVIDYPVRSAPLATLEDEAYWRTLGLDVGLVFTWMHRPSVVAAMGAAGTFAISKGDSDGVHGVRAAPMATLRRIVAEQPGLLAKARRAWYWLKLYSYLFRREEAEMLECLRAADLTVLETETARQNLRRFLCYHGAERLLDKVAVMPHLVSERVLQHAVPTRKERKIVAVGRWDEPQKDAGLLARTVRLHLDRYPDTEVVVIGRGGERWLAPLQTRYPGLRYLGVIPHDEMAEHLSLARICLITSHFESFHIAGHEALSMGCTLVGPAVIPLPDVCSQGPFGTIAEGRRPRQVAAALEAEMQAWDEGFRDPVRTAEFWRERVAPRPVLQGVIDSIERRRAHGSEVRSTVQVHR